MVDCARVALDCLHQQFASRVTCKLGWQSVAATASETSEAAVVPSEDACHDGEVDYAPDAVLPSEASAIVHECEDAGVYASAHQPGQHGVDVVTRAA